jgi:DNA-directed RNA polymerase I subunit RPA1
VCTNEQYIVPTNGKPLRGLIQDHVGSGVKLTGKDCFLTRADFQHVLFCTLSGLPGVEIVKPSGHIQMPAPTVWKPVPLWTGKQMVSAVLHHLTAGLPALNLDFKAKTPASAFGADQEEHEVVIRGGDLLRGVLDKAAFGASEGGLVHGVYEFYGPHHAGRLLTSLGRLLTVYLQFAGHTCGIEDLVLTPEAEGKRRALIDRATRLGALAMDCYTSGRAYEPPAVGQEGTLAPAALARVQARTAELLEEDVRTGAVAQGAAMDNFMRTVLAPVSSDIIRACLPDGLATPFPHNAFSLMVSTGAKGSTVNQSQVSCGLGQQELEGRRVPLMPSGKSLPSFPPYDPSPRAGGYIVDRFLTGVRPQEYYFHCMAGREGLIDTAVKTSRSGYLQRCLVKGLEELRVHYDHTVRDADAGVVQFLYGEDGVDPMHSKYLDGKAPQMTALARNHAALLHQYRIDSGFLRRTGMDMTTARAMHGQIEAGREQVQAAEAEADAARGRDGEASLAVGAIVSAKRLKRGRDEWMAGAWRDGWAMAEVVKVHKAKDKGGKGSKKYPTYDLRYADGSLAKRVPRRVSQQVVEAGGQPSQSSALVEVVRWPYLPEPVLGRAQLGLHLGAVSERFQDAVQEYLRKDPEGILSQSHTAASGSNGSGGGGGRAGLELLLWLKYLRSLAAPGEAVGSIAGQSIGEPSTQVGGWLLMEGAGTGLLHPSVTNRTGHKHYLPTDDAQHVPLGGPRRGQRHAGYPPAARDHHDGEPEHQDALHDGQAAGEREPGGGAAPGLAAAAAAAAGAGAAQAGRHHGDGAAEPGGGRRGGGRRVAASVHGAAAAVRAALAGGGVWAESRAGGGAGGHVLREAAAGHGDGGAAQGGEPGGGGHGLQAAAGAAGPGAGGWGGGGR